MSGAIDPLLRGFTGTLFGRVSTATLVVLPLPPILASSALARSWAIGSIIRPNKIVAAERMPVHAVSLLRLLAAQRIYVIGDGLKVARVATAAIAAQMVNLQAGWDGADENRVAEPMHVMSLRAVDRDETVTTRRAASRPCPAETIKVCDWAEFQRDTAAHLRWQLINRAFVHWRPSHFLTVILSTPSSSAMRCWE